MLPKGKIAARFFDLVTISVPPVLPIAMTMGTIFAIFRLKFKQIYSISPPKINVAGRVNLMVFDKTGTLTEDQLEVHSILPTKTEANLLQFGLFAKDPTKESIIIKAMASCHSLACLNG